jgi:hypothetical protein
MVVMIHDNDRMPNINLGGMYVTTGQLHKLSFNQRKYSSLPEPYTKCKNHANLAMQTVFDQYEYERINYTYSMNACFDTCLQAYM